jgi:hypothetical protein
MADDREPVKLWFRTCQECGRAQAAPEPGPKLTVAFERRKCVKCHSEALDLGSYRWFIDGAEVEWDDDDEKWVEVK